MSPIADQTAGPIGLTFFVDTHGWPGGVLGKKKSIKKKIQHFFFFFFTGNATLLLVFNNSQIFADLPFKLAH